MKNHSGAYKTAIRSPSRFLNARLMLLGKTNIEINDDNIENIEIDEGILANEKFVIGGGIASSISISLSNYDGQYTNIDFKNKWIKVYFKIELEDKTWEEIYYGKYQIEESQITGKNIKLEGFDRLGTLDSKYTTKLVYPAMLSAIVTDMEKTLGLDFGPILKNGTFDFKDLVIFKKPQGTFRQVLTDIAVIAGGFLTCIAGVIDISFLVDTDVEIKNSGSFKTTINNAFIKLAGVNINGFLVGDANGDILGQEILLLDGASEKVLENVAESNFNKYKDMEYVGFNADWQGDFSLCPCDKIKVQDDKDVLHTSIVTNNQIKYRGGLKATTQAKISKDSIESGNIEIQRVQQELKQNNSGIYYYTNESETIINKIPKQLCYFEYATSSSSNLLLFVSLSLEGTGTVEATITVDNKEMLFKPKDSINANGTFTFTYPVLQQEGSSNHNCKVMLSSNADLTIKTEQAQCMLFGQRLIGGLSDTRPHAEVTQRIKYIPVDISGISTNSITQMQVPIPSSMTQNIKYNPMNIVGVKSSVNVSFVKESNVEITDSKCYEATSVTTLTGTVNANVGDYVLATITVRSALTIPAGWLLLKTLGPVDIGDTNQNMSFVYKKIEEPGEVSVSVGQFSPGRIYLNLIAMKNVENIEYGDEYEVVKQNQVKNVTVIDKKNKEKLIWGCSAVSWATGVWGTNPANLVAVSVDQNNDPRQANFIDFATLVEGRNFTPSTGSGTACMVGAVRIIEKVEKEEVL